MKPYFDTAIIVPLNEEFEEVAGHFKFEEDLSTSTQLRFRVSLRATELQLLLVKQEVMGRTASQAALFSTMEDYDLGLGVCLGIAGALSTDLNVGDVCFSKDIVDVLDNAKITQDSNGKMEISFWPTYYQSPIEVITAVNRNRYNPVFKKDYLDWQELSERKGRDLIPSQFIGKSGALETISKPSAIEGLICCGDVCASQAYRDKLRNMHRKVLAIETESGGFFSAAKIRNVSALTVRGISDYADQDKNNLERQTDGKTRKLAIDNATSFLSSQLSSELLSAWFATKRAARQDDKQQLTFLSPPAKDVVGELIASQNILFGEKLTELAPAYTLQSKGYHLPVPRIRVLDNRSGAADEIWSDPTDVRDVLKRDRVLVLTIPKDYPDRSISWVLASDLLSGEIDQKQVIPSVIQAKDLQRPRHGVKELTSDRILQFLNSDDAQLLFVVDEFNFDSKSRTDFLLEQIESLPEARFVIVTRNGTNVVTEGSFSGRCAASIARIDDVSFVEIAHFLQKKFELTAPASEVVAARLKETFDDFELPAHPSYFAGIPRDTLAALLNANRRGELIQLAVAGYLSFIVASDKGKIVLSRTTREDFLTRLAFDMHVNDRVFSPESLVTYVEEVGNRFDYGVPPVQFISAFVSNGILHCEDGEIVFTLPFMESYLLAKRLHEQPDAAITYFKLDREEFDLQTFGLYAELGASVEFIEHVENELTEAADSLKRELNDSHVLLGDKIVPSMLLKPDRLIAIQKRVRKAIADVRADKDRSQEKQRFLDAADRMRERASKKSEIAHDADRGEDEKAIAALEAAVKAWVVAVNLLGSGAERLEGAVKRNLIKGIVEITSLIVDQWTRVHLRVDFSALKEELKADQELLSLVAKSDSPKDQSEARKVLDSLGDLMEYVFLADPLRRMINGLCDEARESILATSFVESELRNEPQSLIQYVWLADIDAKMGRDGLMRSIRELPHSRFLRVTLATHLVTRVFWNHWKKEDRLILLDAANELLKPFGQSYNYNEIRRLIESEQ